GDFHVTGVQTCALPISLHDDFRRFDQVLASRWRLLAGDVPAAHTAVSGQVRDCREAGATSPLIQALLVQAQTQLHYGRYADAQAAATSAIELAHEQHDRRALMQGRVWVLLPIAAIRGEQRRWRGRGRRRRARSAARGSGRRAGPWGRAGPGGCCRWRRAAAGSAAAGSWWRPRSRTPGRIR